VRDMKTYSQSKEDALQSRKWLMVNAEGVTLGRLASEVAVLLKGKHKTSYTPHVDGGDFVVVINAEKLQVTGKKREQKMYRHHSGFVGGLKELGYERVMNRFPERILRHAVKGMLPSGSLGRSMINKLKVYTGPEHPHKAQKPEEYQFKYIANV